jgi:hypothetical protein
MNHDQHETCDLAEIVYEKPLSGEFDEIPFGSDRGNTLWVKFSSKDGVSEWIGKFGDANGRGSRCATKIAEPDKFFITAGGIAYFIDATERKLLRQFDKKNVLDMVFDAQKNLLITADWTRLNWIDSEDKLVTSKGIAVDGIRDLKIEGRILSGLAIADYGGQEMRFWLDLDTLEVLRWDKPWWKFW